MQSEYAQIAITETVVRQDREEALDVAVCHLGYTAMSSCPIYPDGYPTPNSCSDGCKYGAGSTCNNDRLLL